jgi:hypothetical protein
MTPASLCLCGFGGGGEGGAACLQETDDNHKYNKCVCNLQNPASLLQKGVWVLYVLHLQMCGWREYTVYKNC